MHTIKRNIAVFLLLFTVLSLNGAEFFHHHENESLNDDGKCQACLFHSVLSAIDITDASAGLIEISSYQVLALQIHSIPDSDVPVTSSGRAPPQNTF